MQAFLGNQPLIMKKEIVLEMLEIHSKLTWLTTWEDSSAFSFFCIYEGLSSINSDN
jgi:hypothetical protein